MRMPNPSPPGNPTLTGGDGFGMRMAQEYQFTHGIPLVGASSVVRRQSRVGKPAQAFLIHFSKGSQSAWWSRTWADR